MNTLKVISNLNPERTYSEKELLGIVINEFGLGSNETYALMLVAFSSVFMAVFINVINMVVLDILVLVFFVILWRYEGNHVNR